MVYARLFGLSHFYWNDVSRRATAEIQGGEQEMEVPLNPEAQEAKRHKAAKLLREKILRLPEEDRHTLAVRRRSCEIGNPNIFLWHERG